MPGVESCNMRPEAPFDSGDCVVSNLDAVRYSSRPNNAAEEQLVPFMNVDAGVNLPC